MARRVFAAGAAIAMVLLAIVVRDRIDNPDSTPSTGTGALKLVCASELAAVCDALRGETLDVTIEPAVTTADRLATATAEEAGFDGWLAPGPWREIVEASRASSADELFGDDTVLARSPFVLAVWKDKRATLNCAEPLDLGCVGDAVNTRSFRLGMGADTEADGVLADAALAVGHINNASFATNDFGETDLADWITGVDERTDRVGQNPGGRSITALLTFGAASADGYLSTEATIGPELAGAIRRNEFDVLYARPVATADVTFAARQGKRGGQLRELLRSDRVRQLLSENGWRVEGQAPAPGVKTTPPLPDDDGLPSGGVLHELIDLIR